MAAHFSGMDEVFRALADPSRRRLLDSLNVRSGQTLGELCADMDMARQSVSKHLAVLQAAGVVSTVWRGREKLHYLNPSPIGEICRPSVRAGPASSPTSKRCSKPARSYPHQHRHRRSRPPHPREAHPPRVTLTQPGTGSRPPPNRNRWSNTTPEPRASSKRIHRQGETTTCPWPAAGPAAFGRSFADRSLVTRRSPQEDCQGDAPERRRRTGPPRDRRAGWPNWESSKAAMSAHPTMTATE